MVFNPFPLDGHMEFRTRRLRLNGTGTDNMAVDGSSTPQLYKISPTASGTFGIARILIEIRDDGVWAETKFGSIATLANGLQIGLWDDTTGDLVNDFLDGGAINYNSEWGAHCYDYQVNTLGQGESTLTARWTFTKAGLGINISAERGLALGVKVRDDLSDLSEFEIKAQGFYRANG